MSEYKDILFVVYIITKHLIASGSFFLKNLYSLDDQFYGVKWDYVTHQEEIISLSETNLIGLFML